MTEHRIILPRPREVSGQWLSDFQRGHGEEFTNARGEWWDAIGALMPPNAYRSSYESCWRWSNDHGLWTLLVDWRAPSPLTLMLGWGGVPPRDENSRAPYWPLLDYTPEYVRSFLIVHGAIEAP